MHVQKLRRRKKALEYVNDVVGRKWLFETYATTVKPDFQLEAQTFVQRVQDDPSLIDQIQHILDVSLMSTDDDDDDVDRTTTTAGSSAGGKVLTPYRRRRRRDRTELGIGMMKMLDAARDRFVNGLRPHACTASETATSAGSVQRTLDWFDRCSREGIDISWAYNTEGGTQALGSPQGKVGSQVRTRGPQSRQGGATAVLTDFSSCACVFAACHFADSFGCLLGFFGILVILCIHQGPGVGTHPRAEARVRRPHTRSRRRPAQMGGPHDAFSATETDSRSQRCGLDSVPSFQSAILRLRQGYH